MVVAVDPAATDADADPNGDITLVGLRPRISHFVDHLFGVLGFDVMVCWGIASFLSDRERAQMGFRFIFQFPIGMTFRVGTLDSPPPSPPLDVSGAALAPQPPPAKAARGRGDSSPR